MLERVIYWNTVIKYQLLTLSIVDQFICTIALVLFYVGLLFYLYSFVSLLFQAHIRGWIDLEQGSGYHLRSGHFRTGI